MSSDATNSAIVWSGLVFGTVVVCEFVYRYPTTFAAACSLTLIVLPLSKYVFEASLFWEYETGSRAWWAIYVKQCFVIGVVAMPLLVLYRSYRTSVATERGSLLTPRSYHVGLPRFGHFLTASLCANIAWTLPVEWANYEHGACAYFRSAIAVHLMIKLLSRSWAAHRSSRSTLSLYMIRPDQTQQLPKVKVLYGVLSPLWCAVYLWWNALFAASNYSARCAYHNLSALFAVLYDLGRHDRVRRWQHLLQEHVFPPEQLFLWWRAMTLSMYLATSAIFGLWPRFREIDEGESDCDPDCSTSHLAFTVCAFALGLLDVYHDGSHLLTTQIFADDALSTPR
ncbi:hypothetical protein CYMTET_3851 [Cymbomonas tetramitiformis]|uniref:Uncharacterized protein n=1 Tax=Cymbomonas tetramitiformis TaxID=36881 RepID=A0AAE0LKK9_9CHLO|nr:hypothetical protein CYMTET_3851 [Cymbomonas tetramitiformis]